MSVDRRAFLAGGAAAALTTVLGAAHARGRTPVGGRLSMRVPWPVGPVDPHRIDDPFAAIFCGALFDSLYAWAPDGQIVPALAEAEPKPDGASLRVELRAGLRTGKERPLGTKDAAWSIARSRGSGGRGWLADVPAPRDDGRALVFATKDAARLVHALASPIASIVPIGFSPELPDGTGPFRFGARDGAVVLSRNRLAARGPSFLDEVVVRAAPRIESSMLAFEAGTDDLGWFERGLHEPRAGSERFDHGTVGWVVLSTGRGAGSWDAPGVAQRICDGVPYARLKSLHVGAEWPAEPELGWGGPPGQLLVRDDAAWLIEVAQAVAATITRPSHEVTVKPIPAAELASRRASRAHALALDVVRNVGPGGVAALVAVATAESAARAQEIMQHPPRLGDAAPRTMTRTLRAGIIGEIRILGGKMPELVLARGSAGSGFDLGSSYRARR